MSIDASLDDAGDQPEPAATRLSDFELPQLIAHAEALTGNVAIMAEYCARAGVLLAPHAKTTMSRRLIDEQLRAGAWGMTVAIPRQARAVLDFGVQRVLLANVLVDAPAVRWVADAFLAGSGPEFLCYVESLEGVELLDRELSEAHTARPLQVLLELGVPGARTGVRDLGLALAIAERVAASDRLTLVGTAGFEGVLPAEDPQARPSTLPAFLGLIHRATDSLVERGLVAPNPIVSAGGSSYFDAVVEFLGPQTFGYPVRTVLRSGCYVSHDHGMYHRTSPLDGRSTDPAGPHLVAALELLASVWATPEPGLVIAGFGRRDVPFDDRLPIVLGRYGAGGELHALDGWQVEKLWDQHAWIRVPTGTTIPLGAVLSLGISHPCGAFDRWRQIPVLGADRTVVDTLRPAL